MFCPFLCVASLKWLVRLNPHSVLLGDRITLKPHWPLLKVPDCRDIDFQQMPGCAPSHTIGPDRNCTWGQTVSIHQRNRRRCPSLIGTGSPVVALDDKVITGYKWPPRNFARCSDCEFFVLVGIETERSYDNVFSL